MRFDGFTQLFEIALYRLAEVQQHAARIAFLFQPCLDLGHRRLTFFGEILPFKLRELSEMGRSLLVVGNPEDFVEFRRKLDFAAPPSLSRIIPDRPGPIEHQLSAGTKNRYAHILVRIAAIDSATSITAGLFYGGRPGHRIASDDLVRLAMEVDIYRFLEDMLKHRLITERLRKLGRRLEVHRVIDGHEKLILSRPIDHLPISQAVLSSVERARFQVIRPMLSRLHTTSVPDDESAWESSRHFSGTALASGLGTSLISPPEILSTSIWV